VNQSFQNAVKNEQTRKTMDKTPQLTSRDEDDISVIPSIQNSQFQSPSVNFDGSKLSERIDSKRKQLCQMKMDSSAMG
jgi:hypothetical protein